MKFSIHWVPGRRGEIHGRINERPYGDYRISGKRGSWWLYKEGWMALTTLGVYASVPEAKKAAMAEAKARIHEWDGL